MERDIVSFVCDSAKRSDGLRVLRLGDLECAALDAVSVASNDSILVLVCRCSVLSRILGTDYDIVGLGNVRSVC
jgi:hypothetical protein